MKNKKHSLIDPNTEKVHNLNLKGKILASEASKAGKLRSTEKEFSSTEEALMNFYKKEWELLKKGFVLYNEGADTGNPVLHKFISGHYTGALAFAESPDSIFVYRDSLQHDEIMGSLEWMDKQGVLIKTIQLPKALAWDMIYRPHTNSLLLDIDHSIYEFAIATEEFHSLGNNNQGCTSFVSVSKEITAWATSGKIHITNNQNEHLYTLHYEEEVVKGSVPFCAKLSKDGQLLAFHNRGGEIQIIDTITGHLNKIVSSINMVYQFEFADNNKLLVVREQYGSWGMRYFDLPKGEEIQIKEIEIPEYTKDVNAFCFNVEQTKLVLVQHNRAHVFDFPRRKLLHSFKIDHLVKTCNIAFIGEKLGVRTDYGCFSLYTV